MALQDIAEFFDPTLRLPMRGKVYVVESPDAVTGVHIQRLFNTATAAASGVDISEEDLAAIELDDDQERDLYPRVLGDVYAQMIADGLPWVWIKHAGTTALMWIGVGMDAAERFWSEAPQGEARRPEPQDHKAPAKKRAPRKAAASPVSPASLSESPVVPRESPSIS